MANTRKQEKRKPETIKSHKSKSRWVARAAGTGDYFGWENNEGTAWVPLTAAYSFNTKEEASNAISVPVTVEICEIDTDRNIINIENPYYKQ